MDTPTNYNYPNALRLGQNQYAAQYMLKGYMPDDSAPFLAEGLRMKVYTFAAHKDTWVNYNPENPEHLVNYHNVVLHIDDAFEMKTRILTWRFLHLISRYAPDTWFKYLYPSMLIGSSEKALAEAVLERLTTIYKAIEQKESQQMTGDEVIPLICQPPKVKALA